MHKVAQASRKQRRGTVGLSPLDFPPGVVAVTSGDLTRYADFSFSLISLQMPPSTKVVWARGVSIVQNLNSILRNGFLPYPEYRWVFLLGDDHVFKPDLLLKMLAHRLDLVAPLCVKRKPPLSPIVFSAETAPGLFKTLNWDELPSGGLLEVPATSPAGMLVRRPVIEAVPEPWFEYGQADSALMGEDLWFQKKARQKGFKIYVDLDTFIGHQTPVVIYPVNTENGWGVEIDFDNQFTTRITIPPKGA